MNFDNFCEYRLDYKDDNWCVYDGFNNFLGYVSTDSEVQDFLSSLKKRYELKKYDYNLYQKSNNMFFYPNFKSIKLEKLKRLYKDKKMKIYMIYNYVSNSYYCSTGWKNSKNLNFLDNSLIIYTDFNYVAYKLKYLKNSIIKSGEWDRGCIIYYD